MRQHIDAKIFTQNNKLMGGGHSSGGIVCIYHPEAAGSNPKDTNYAFFNLYY